MTTYGFVLDNVLKHLLDKSARRSLALTLSTMSAAYIVGDEFYNWSIWPKLQLFDVAVLTREHLQFVSNFCETWKKYTDLK